MKPVTQVQLITALHASSLQGGLVFSGGGASVAAALLNVPGASRTVVEIQVPYAIPALEQFLCFAPERACSVATSQAMARRAWQRARWLADTTEVFGLGCTASLATDRPKKGAHRFHVSLQTTSNSLTQSLTLTKDVRTREVEEQVVCALVLNLLAEAAGLSERIRVPLLPNETVLTEQTSTGGLLRQLLAGEITWFIQEADGRWHTEGVAPTALLSGSFNPLHTGHLELARAAGQYLRQPVMFELSVTNADKPVLDGAALYQRLEQFLWQGPVVVTQAPTFAEKSQLFPGVVLIMGIDTAIRLIDPKYYQGDPQRRDDTLAQLLRQGTRVLVAGRADVHGHFRTVANVEVSPRLRDLWIPLPEFRLDVSSTAIRESG